MKYMRLLAMIFVIHLIVLLLPASFLAKGAETADLIHLPSDTKKVHIRDDLFILEDKHGEWELDDVMKEPLADQFERNHAGTPNFGYTSSSYWAHFTIKNDTDITSRILEVAYAPLHEFDVYVLRGGQVDEVHYMGAKYPFHTREFANPEFAFSFVIHQQEELTFYIRFRTDGSMQMPIHIWEKSGYTLNKQLSFLSMGLFYGIMGVMAVYNLFLYFSLRHRSYLYYVLVICTTSFTNLTLNGLAYQFFWPDAPWWNTRSIVFFMCLGCIFALFFANSFLEFDKNLPTGKKLLWPILGFNGFNLLLCFISYQLALQLMVIGLSSMVLFVLVSGAICWTRGARQARFFILAWFVFLVGVLMSLLADSGLLPLTFITRNIWQVSAVFEVVLLSLALADRINILRAEKKEAVMRAQENQLLAVENLKRSDELKDEFLAITSHELRTPLYGIIGLAQSLTDGVAGTVTPVMKKNLELIVASGRRLTGLVNDLLDFSKLKHGAMDIKLQPIRLKELVDVLLPMCKQLLHGKQISIHNQIDEHFPPIIADQNRFIQMLYNLIGNAIKYTDAGEVTISATQTEHAHKIHVSDTGKGLTDAEMAIIFEPFRQVSNSVSRDFGGTGIGINITKQLIELHGGKLEVQSVPGKGSIFTLTFPKALRDAVGMEQGAATLPTMLEQVEGLDLEVSTPKDQPKKKRGRILVADDEYVNLQVLLNQLSMEGYEVFSATNGADVLKLVDTTSIDLVILDIMMPHMSGFEVCSKLRETYTLTELPILMLTAKNQIKDKLTSFEAGANDYLTKPCDKGELLSRVETLISLRRLTSEMATLNEELQRLNESLEQKVKLRTKELVISNEKLSNANESLREMEESRTQLFSSITHEIGTPITLIQSYFQAVNEGLIQKNNPHYLHMINNKLVVLERLTSDLFDLAVLKTGKMGFSFQLVPLAAWWQQAVDVARADIEQSGRTFVYPEKLPEPLDTHDWQLSIDGDRMNQLMLNLIWNAMKHTSEATGTIELKMNYTLQTARDPDHPGIVIGICDNGRGIKEEAIPHLFERYYKVDDVQEETVKGTGLGLAIVKEIVQAHNGSIEVESKPHIGTSFYIELPLFS